jgi:hypothetical protein
MVRRNLLLGVLLLFIAGAGLWVTAYRKLPSEPDMITLKDNTQIKGEIVRQEFGKYVVIEKVDNSRQVIVWEQVKDIKLFNPPWYLRVNDALEWVIKFGIIGGFMVFGVGLWQYSDSQKWKRSEFLLKEVRAFEPNPNVINVREMLQNGGGNIYFYGKKEEPIAVDGPMMISAFSEPGELGRKHTDEELAIRHALNDYLSHFDHFNNIIESRLVRKKELKLYIEYWMDIIGNPKNPKLAPDVRSKLWTYMPVNGFKGAIDLLKKYGYENPALREPQRSHPKRTIEEK